MLTVFRLFAGLSLPLLQALGALFGWVAYICSPTYRRRLDANAELAALTPACCTFSRKRRR